MLLFCGRFQDGAATELGICFGVPLLAKSKWEEVSVLCSEKILPSVSLPR